MKAIEILTREHNLILRALDVLSRARIHIERNQRPPEAFFDTALLFLREFADQFHHFKEEYLMFGLLALKKGDAFDGPIGSLRFQHERCRAFIEGISNSLPGYEMLVGKRPFDENDPRKVEDLRLHQDIPDPMRSAPNFPKNLSHFILKSCRRDPALRYADMNQALGDSKRIAAALQAPR